MEVSNLVPPFSANLDCFCLEKKGVAAAVAVEDVVAEDDAVAADGVVVGDGVAVENGGVEKDDVAAVEEHDASVAEGDVAEKGDFVGVGDGVAVGVGKDAWAAEGLAEVSSSLLLDRAMCCNCFHGELGVGAYYDEQDTHFASLS